MFRISSSYFSEFIVKKHETQLCVVIFDGSDIFRHFDAGLRFTGAILRQSFISDAVSGKIPVDGASE